MWEPAIGFREQVRISMVVLRDIESIKALI
jgi:hypothetical protein